jgi:hypothetical protein
MKTLTMLALLLCACGDGLTLGTNNRDGGLDGATMDAASTVGHKEGEACDDGLACVAGLVCKAVGDPCPTYPNCKTCWVPCDSAGPNTCAVGQSCIAPHGQGGDVCIGQKCTLTTTTMTSCTASGTECVGANAYCSSWDVGYCACNGQFCTPGQDHTCNLDQTVSANLGHCRTDNLCDCGNGIKDPVSGKCK